MNGTGLWYVAYRAEGRVSGVVIDAFDNHDRAVSVYDSMKLCPGEVHPPYYATDDAAATAFLTRLLARTGELRDGHQPD